MSCRAAGITASVVTALLAAIVLAARRARTEHPPVSPSVPRIDDLG
ncbi:hypothetical protein [Gordonia caeni]